MAKAPKANTPKVSSTSSAVLTDFQEAFNISKKAYFAQVNNNPRLKLIDTFCFFLVLLGIIQFAFIVLIRDNFPFNAFLSGFIICVGQFVLLMSLRLQLGNSFPCISKGRPFGEFVVASLILHFICLHFIN
ncbi:ost2p [Saccharomyces arboricola H-6]|uniref:Dolichyl-diphosphooligosaccharide--protein glycosyltransferase subunit OST2 n=1 Tax=Saccharomyces arboricola (strain H-6 / AS 2.3317 / CBS 10644) TaxID=1160507 RepID=J8PHX9_SACAR|nr:ost2p [Saccharomyces arboricola H-6]